MTSPGLVKVSRSGPVVTVRLADQDGHNAFTPGLVDRLGATLAAAVADPEARVVVLAGLPGIFSAGGSRESLLGPPGSRETLEHDLIIRAPLRCPLPVVAAMRGHAIGGGFLLGLYADIPVLSERSVYTANFLGYGFMPCMGATWVLPHRLGGALAAEALLGAARFRGRELRERGAAVTVVAHDAVEDTAAELAGRIAAAPRRALELAKAALVAPWLAESDQAFEREVPGHLETLQHPMARQAVAAGYGQL